MEFLNIFLSADETGGVFDLCDIQLKYVSNDDGPIVIIGVYRTVMEEVVEMLHKLGFLVIWLSIRSITINGQKKKRKEKQIKMAENANLSSKLVASLNLQF